ncbi:unnamed protein product [Lampetra planeri]
MKRHRNAAQLPPSAVNSWTKGSRFLSDGISIRGFGGNSILAGISSRPATTMAAAHAGCASVARQFVKGYTVFSSLCGTRLVREWTDSLWTLSPSHATLAVTEDNELTSLQVARGIQTHLDLNDRPAVAASTSGPAADEHMGASFNHGLEGSGAVRRPQVRWLAKPAAWSSLPYLLQVRLRETHRHPLPPRDHRGPAASILRLQRLP